MDNGTELLKNKKEEQAQSPVDSICLMKIRSIQLSAGEARNSLLWGLLICKCFKMLCELNTFLKQKKSMGHLSECKKAMWFSNPTVRIYDNLRAPIPAREGSRKKAEDTKDMFLYLQKFAYTSHLPLSFPPKLQNWPHQPQLTHRPNIISVISSVSFLRKVKLSKLILDSASCVTLFLQEHMILMPSKLS